MALGDFMRVPEGLPRIIAAVDEGWILSNDNARSLVRAYVNAIEALRDLVERCDGEEGVRPDGSNISTYRAHAELSKSEGA
jgi:hypothetical protein